MASKKDIKGRIASVSSTQQIVQAMHMVATSKLQQCQQQLIAARPMFTEIQRIVDGLTVCEEAAANPFIKPRTIKSSAYVVISSNRGLCGGYNNNVAQLVLKHIRAGKKNEKIISVGLRGRDILQRRGKHIYAQYNELTETTNFDDVRPVAQALTSLYLTGEVDEIFVAYTKFESALAYTPHLVCLLPFVSGNEATVPPMVYDAGIHAFLEDAVPMYLSAFLYGAIIESDACEQASRMVSMDAASGNASDIIEDLTRMFNRIRQTAITQEISEIIGGANMLK